MPATWTTEEQVDFLKEQLPGFLTVQCQERAPRYLKELMEHWFTRWPEHDILFPNVADVTLTAEENETLAASIATRKKVRLYILIDGIWTEIKMQQLKTWMYWFAAKEKRGSTKADATWLKDAINNHKGSRSLQAIEVYQQQNKEKIEEHMKAEIAQQGAKTKKECMSICHWVVAEMWDEEDGGIVAEIHEEADKQKKERQRNNVSGKYILGKSGEE
jgi:hypothetical protein